MCPRKKQHTESLDQIVLQGVKTHNLKNIDVNIPKNKITTITGVSWSGKSSLAFHTIYKEGQFRYIESLSSYLRQFFNLGSRPDLEYSEWLSPAIAIEQNKRVGNVRSTVGTLTEIDDYLRLLLAKLGDVYCYGCHAPLKPQTTEQIVDEITRDFLERKVYLLQDMSTIVDKKKLGQRVRRNRRMVDQWAWVTRFLVEFNCVEKSSPPIPPLLSTPRTSSLGERGEIDCQGWSERVEYFYLEDPNVPKEYFPVKLYGIFDRVTINNSTIKRLKDDVIKMLGRSEKFGILCLEEETESTEVRREKEENVKGKIQNIKGKSRGPEENYGAGVLVAHPQYWDSSFIMNNSVAITDERKQQLITHEHTDDGFIHTTRALIKNKKGEYLALYDKRFNHYQVPGGKVDAGESIEEGLIREVEEEIGVKVKQVKYLWSAKVFFRLGAFVEHIFEIEIVWEPQVMEPEKCSHIWRGKVTKAKTKSITIDFGDIKRVWIDAMMDAWTYNMRVVESGLCDILQEVGDYQVSLPPVSSLERETRYVAYLDLKAKVLHFAPAQWWRKSKNKVMVFSLLGRQILEGYGVVMKTDESFDNHCREENYEASVFVASPQDDAQQITRYTDKYYCANCNISYPEFGAQHFSANRQEGACQKCHGIGEILQADFNKILDPFSSYLHAVLPWRDSNYGQGILKKLAQKYDINENTHWKDLPDWFRSVVIEGDDELIKVSTGGGKFASLYYRWIEDVLTAQYNKWILTIDFQAMLDVKACPECGGAKLRKESLSVFIEMEKATSWKRQATRKKKYNIYDLQKLPIESLLSVIAWFVKETKKPLVLVERITKPLIDRARTITELWLGYIDTSRKIDSLSWGEIQRLRLAKQLGNKLTWIIYVLDEPTIGLDEGEIIKVINSIEELCDMGNTIIVVEHNDTFIKASDWIVEVGPWAGDFWWAIVYNGDYEHFLKSKTLTADYLLWKKHIIVDFEHQPSREEICIRKAHKHNLQNIDVTIKLGSFTIITGPSGAGKTTLMYHTLFTFLSEKQKWVQSRIRLALLKEWMSWAEIIQAPVMQRKKYEHMEQLALQEFYDHIGVETITWYSYVDNVLYVDQSSIGKTPRSCPATFVKVLDDIRKIYAGVTEAKMLAFNAGHFSFNSNKWWCPECKGYGYKKVELQFLPDTYVPCSLCKGRRYKPEILDIKRHGKTIAEVLEMYVMDALAFFEDVPFVADKLALMCDIGLGYLKMGQPAHTLSGGESQRLKLVKHLLKSYKGHTIYFLDEPTVGLHPADIERLLKVLKKFLDHGDTILMIEHDKSLLQFADQVVKLNEGKKG